jgi:hypothetical protein
MSRRIWYVAHPVGDGPDRASNVARAKRWVRWLIGRYTECAISVPWLPYVELLDESPENRARGIGDDLAVLRRCDTIVLVGGVVTPGMKAELEEARHRGLEVLDLTHLGAEPPA